MAKSDSIPCKTSGCDRFAELRGWCRPHYKRWKRNGEEPVGPVASRLGEVERFWSYVDTSAGDNDCWPWRGVVNHKGYGLFFYRGKLRSAHRVAISIPGPFPDRAVVVMHACDTPPCCNPRHLRYGSVAENNRDMMRKGRWKKPPGRPRLLREKCAVEQCPYQAQTRQWCNAHRRRVKLYGDPLGGSPGRPRARRAKLAASAVRDFLPD